MVSLKQISSFLIITFVIVIFGQMGVRSYLSTWYFLDNESFENAYCENLDLPDVMCHGSCKINKLNTQSDGDDIISNTEVKLTIEYISPDDICIVESPISILDSPTLSFDIFDFYSSPFLDALYLPPIHT